jgi:hypothetical protein
MMEQGGSRFAGTFCGHPRRNRAASERFRAQRVAYQNQYHAGGAPLPLGGDSPVIKTLALVTTSNASGNALVCETARGDT